MRLSIALCSSFFFSHGVQADGPQDACHEPSVFPYADDASYRGLHGNRENNNRVPCEGPAAVEPGWHALQGLLIFQPITLGPGGHTLYATASRTEGCQLYAVDTRTGQTLWCRDGFSLGLSAGTPEVDEDGNLYLTDGWRDGSWVISLTPEGAERWRTSLEGLGGSGPAPVRSPAALHFSPEGRVVTLTVDGVVVLLDRASGAVDAHFDIPTATGFVPVQAHAAPRRLPRYLKRRLKRVVGPLDRQDMNTIMGASTGASGAFSDNTVGVSSWSQLFVIGGGPDPGTGALTALELDELADPPTLSYQWHLPIRGGSATSPAISANGRWVAVGDDASQLLMVDILACNQNTDADADPQVCAPAWIWPIAGRPLLGSVAVDEDGTVYAWHAAQEPEHADVFAITGGEGGPRVVWETALAEAGAANMQWTSCITVLDDMIIGAVTEMTRVKDLGLGVPLVLEAHHEAIALHRRSGAVLWRVPIPDDSINSLAVGRDGSIYVPLLGMFDLASPSRHADFQGGVIQLRPVQATSQVRSVHPRPAREPSSSSTKSVRRPGMRWSTTVLPSREIQRRMPLSSALRALLLKNTPLPSGDRATRVTSWLASWNQMTRPR